MLCTFPVFYSFTSDFWFNVFYLLSYFADFVSFLFMFSSFCQLPLENRKRGIRLLRVIIVWANFIMAFIFNYQQGQFKSMPYINLLLSLTIINLFMHSDHDDSINDGYCQCNVCISKSSKL